MSMYAVLLYKNTSNPESIPGDWPSEIKIIEDGASVEAPWQIMSIPDYNTYISDPVLVDAKDAWNLVKSGQSSPFAMIVTENFICNLPVEDPRHAFFSFTADETGDKLRIAEGTSVEVNITIKDYQGNLVPVTDGFALPLTGEGMPTQLLFIQFINGAATLNISFPLTGLYEISQDTLNRELPPGAKFKFNGLRIYVLKLPS